MYISSGDNRVLAGNAELARRGGCARASAREEHASIGAAEEVVSKHGGVTRRSSDESNQV